MISSLRSLSRSSSRQCRTVWTRSHPDEIRRAVGAASRLVKIRSRFDGTLMEKAHMTMETLERHRATGEEAINAGFRLIARLKREGNPGTFFNPLLRRWKLARLCGRKVPSVNRVLQHLKAFPFDSSSYSIICSLKLHSICKEMKPVVVEEFLDRIVRKNMTPDVYIFEQLLRAWVNSGNYNTEECFPGILHRMQRHFKLPHTETIYALLIQYWADETNADEIDLTLELLRLYALKPNLTICVEVIRGLSDAGQPAKAAKYWFKILEELPNGPQLRWCLVRGAVRIIQSHKRGVELASRRIPNYTAFVEKFTEQALRQCGNDLGLKARILGALIEFYTESKAYKEAFKTYERIERPSVDNFCSLARLFGRLDKADDASAFMFANMKQRSPRIKAYNSLLLAWEESSKSYCGDRAMEILQKLKDDGLTPDMDTYFSMLDIFANSTRHSVQAKELLKEMMDAGLHVDQDHYDYVVQAFVKSEDWTGCRSLLLERSNAGYPPTVETYNDHVFRICNPELAEEILLTMQAPQVNTESYNEVLINWTNSPRLVAPKRAYQLYKSMSGGRIEPDLRTYAILISYFSKRDLERAYEVFRDVDSNLDVDPDRRHYNPLMRACLKHGHHRRAGDILLRRASRYLQTNSSEVKPRAESIHEVIEAWIVAGDLVGATNMLLVLHKKFPLSIFEDTYELVIDAWKASNKPGKHKPIRQIQKLLRDAEPDKEAKRANKMEKDTKDMSNVFSGMNVDPTKRNAG